MTKLQPPSAIECQRFRWLPDIWEEGHCTASKNETQRALEHEGDIDADHSILQDRRYDDGGDLGFPDTHSLQPLRDWSGHQCLNPITLGAD